MYKQIGFKLLLIAFCILAGVFSESIIPLINKIIELKINILGFFLEPFLQWAFAMSLRQAQIVSAWIYMLIATLIAWYLFRKIYTGFINDFQALRQVWRKKNQWQKMRFILLCLVALSVLVKLVLIFV